MNQSIFLFFFIFCFQFKVFPRGQFDAQTRVVLARNPPSVYRAPQKQSGFKMRICAGEVRAANKTWHVHDLPWTEPGREGRQNSQVLQASRSLRFVHSFSETRLCRCSVLQESQPQTAQQKICVKSSDCHSDLERTERARFHSVNENSCVLVAYCCLYFLMIFPLSLHTKMQWKAVKANREMLVFTLQSFNCDCHDPV